MASKNISLHENEMEEDETYEFADQMLDSFVPPLVLNAIIDMGVLQIIHDNSGGLSPTEIAARIEAHNPTAPEMLDRMLRLLATYSVVTCTVVPIADGGVERRYKPSQMTKCFVPDESGVSLAPMLSLNTSKVFLESWSKLKETVLEGGKNPFERVHGMQLFEYSRVDPIFNKTYNRAMYEHSIRTMKMILAKYQGFMDIQLLVDVGGGLGQNLGLITSQYSSMKGINFDLPHVIQHAPQYHGVEHIGGNMLESIPEGDAIFLKWILHMWSDEDCLKLLRNCYKSLPENGKVIVVESIVPDEPDTSNYAKLVARMDVSMMTLARTGGKERTIKEFESLAKAAGFSLLKLVIPISRLWVMELYK